MENLNQYIKEALVNHKIKSKYSYHPKTKDELIEYIQIELDKGNTDLNCIDTSNITDMEKLFNQIEGIQLSGEQQENLDISEWNVSNVENMRSMFWGCKQFNSNLSTWDVSKVQNMKSMFYNCKSFNCDLSKWDVSKVKDMAYMFNSCIQFNSNLSNWNVSNVSDINLIFNNSGLKGNKPSWYYKKYNMI